jgi:N-acetylneuraminic acid mutarotase
MGLSLVEPRGGIGNVTKRSRDARRKKLAVVATAGALAAGLMMPVLATTAAAATAGGLGPPNTFAATSPLGVAESGQTATLLPNGQVLIAAGGTANAELYNPATRAFSRTANMPVAVTDATATLLRSGQVLVAGGLQGSRQVTNAELYNPATGKWSPTGALNVARSGQTATLLPNGQVLVAGGGCNGHAYGCDAGSFLSTLTSAELYNPATGTWAKTGSMKFSRQFHTATLLPDGQVLAAGGFNNCDDDFCSDVASAELYNPATGTWTQTGSMPGAREQQSATLLKSGEVLVAGGLNSGGFCCSQFKYSSAELYNPATGTWTPTASMATTHVGQTATLLPNGWVLVAGGGTSVAEIYEPQAGLWVSPGPMTTVRTHQTATLLPNGRVLMAGGDGPDSQPQASAEEFLGGTGPLVTIAPASVAFSAQQVGTISAAQFYKVTNVGSGNLVVSGATVTGKNPGDFRAHTGCASAPVAPGGTCTVALRFAPTSISLRSAAVAVADNAPRSPQGVPVTGYGGGPDAWVPVGPMSAAREHFTATLLPDGKVLMAGGQSQTAASLASAELYNPATRSFSPTGSLNTARSDPAAALLPDGKVLITGGLTSNFIALSSAELYNPATGTWAATTPMNASSYGLTATLLPSGNVLVAGFGGTTPAEVYNPAKATWTNTGPLAVSQGPFPTATLLQNGQVLLAGGGTAEVYNPATNAWTATGPMNAARQNPVSALLSDGDVLVAGGSAPNGGAALASAELYDPATGKWTATGSLIDARYAAAAVLLPGGTPMITGGCSSCSNQPALASAEIFDGSFWLPVNGMTQARVFQTATLLPDGSVLVAGGGQTYYGAATSTAELYTPVQVSVNPGSGPVGAKVTVTGSNFYAGESVTLYWDGGTILGKVKTNPAGGFTTTVTIPQATAGAHAISANGRRSFASVSTAFTVTG